MIFGDIFTYKEKELCMCILKIESKDISQTKKSKKQNTKQTEKGQAIGKSKLHNTHVKYLARCLAPVSGQ